MFRNVHLKTNKKRHSSCLITICVPNIFKHAVDVSNILSHMCAIASFSNGWLLGIVWDVFRIHSMFFPSVMVQLLRLIWGTFSICSWFVCLFLRFILDMLIIAWCSIASHNAAQRQRTEVIFFFLFSNFYLQKIWIENSDNWTTWKNRLQMMEGGW